MMVADGWGGTAYINPINGLIVDMRSGVVKE